MCPSSPFELSNDFAIGGLNDCNNHEINAIIVCRHEITEYQYSQMVINFFGTPDVRPKSYLMSSFNLDSVTDCTASCIRYDPDDTDGKSNDGITADLGPYRSNQRFSVQLFKGLQRVFGVDRIEFSKALNDDDEVTVVFKAYRNDNVVYLGNIATRWPNEI